MDFRAYLLAPRKNNRVVNRQLALDGDLEEVEHRQGV